MFSLIVFLLLGLILCSEPVSRNRRLISLQVFLLLVQQVKKKTAETLSSIKLLEQQQTSWIDHCHGDSSEHTKFFDL